MRSGWAIALVLVLAACSGTGVEREGRVTAPSPEQTVRPSPGRVSKATSGRPVAQWLRAGGLAAHNLAASSPPSLVVYADGRAIADAAHELRLPPPEVKALLKALEHDLAGQPETASPRPGTPVVYDAPTTVLGFDGGGGMEEVAVPYLEAGGYDAVLVDARDRLARLAGRVIDEGHDYAADRLQLSVSYRGAGQAVELWPDDALLPPGTQAGSGAKTYKGDKALAIVRLIPRAGIWHFYRTSSGKQIALSWRYLLPHE
ncbi:hypothetical protein ACIBG8_08480 [Nonomuraea sp. NPDC050556]|uniref:hypothetical protein n=1 Tax=Nonomuraea sp. NPDC050556 TaxID=3364369 RepID=UPI0037A6412A